ncbi:MAG: TraX family protein [Coriobacteriales bacterium]|nr:TraX family protein [Coriobacteriales bacterium]
MPSLDQVPASTPDTPPAQASAPKPAPVPAPDSLFPERYRFLSGSALKLIAVVTMLTDHVCKRILVAYPQFNVTLYSFFGEPVTWTVLLTSIGRLAFPIFCFLLVEGFLHTRNRWRYGRNLLIFALISELPFDLSRTLMFWDPTYQNVFFTLFIGYAGLCALEHLKDKPTKQSVLVISLAIASMALKCDYGPRGYALILILYVLRDNALVKTALGCCVELGTWRAGLAFIPINLYNGKRGFIQGPVLKFAFYSFYPLHLFVLWQLRLVLGV